MKFFRLLLLLLILMPYLAQAQGWGDKDRISEAIAKGAGSNQSSYTQAIPVGFSFTPPPTDISVAYLSDIFGVVDGVLHGTGSQLLGTLFGVFNAAVLTLAGVVISYILFVSTMNTAHHGKIMGDKWSSIWIPMRAVIGVGALLPKASGYSFIQILLMWLVVQGIGAADSIWYAALNYFQRGGILVQHIQSIVQMSDSQGVNNNLDLILKANDILKMQTCMYTLRNGLQNIKPPNTQVQPPTVPDFTSSIKVAGKTSGLVPPCYDPHDQRKGCESPSPAIGRDTAGIINFPGDVSYSGVPLLGVCGNISWNFASTGGASQGAFNPANLAGYDPRSIAVQQMVLDLQPYAFTLARILLPTGQGQTGKIPASNDFPPGSLINAATDYITLIKPALNVAGQQAAGKVRDTLTEAALRGWILAGSYYFTLSRLNQAVKGISDKGPDTNNYPKDFSGQAFRLNPLVRTQLENVDLAKNFATFGSGERSNAAQQTTGNPVGPQPAPQPGQQQAWYQQFPGKNPPSYIEPTYLTPVSNIPLPIPFAKNFPPEVKWLADTLNFVPEQINNLINGLQDNIKAIGTLQATTADPLLSISNLGYQILTTVEYIWLTGAATALVVGLLSVAGACNPWGYAFLSFLAWFVPMLTAILFAMWIAGAIMAFYVPLIPLIIFMFTAIGWFVAVIEAMIAGPLVAIGIIMPEGHEYFGQAQHAIMLTLNVFLRPTLIIFGFISACILVNVALWLWNLAYGVAMSQDIMQTHLLSPGVNVIVSSIAIIVIYMTVVLAIVNRCFTLTYEIALQVLQWIGGHAREFGEKQGGQLEGEFAKGMAPVKAAGEASVKGTMSGIESGAQAAKKRGEEGSHVMPK